MKETYIQLIHGTFLLVLQLPSFTVARCGVVGKAKSPYLNQAQSLPNHGQSRSHEYIRQGQRAETT